MQKLSSTSASSITTEIASPSVPRWLALIPAGLAFVLYLITCSPAINFTDSGELVTVAWTGGIAHPPGYPLYTLLGIIFVHLPFGDPAWRMNLLSALFAALAVGLFYALVTYTLTGMAAFRRATTRRVSGSKPSAKSTRTVSASTSGGAKGTAQKAQTSKKDAASVSPSPATLSEPDESSLGWTAAGGGFAAAGLLATSLTFWNWATQAKFYSLHFAFVAALLWLALLARRALVTHIAEGAPLAPRWPMSAWPSSIRRLHLLALVIGFSLTNHYLTFLVLPAIACLLLSPVRYARELFRHILRHIGTLILALLLPLLLYLYLPIRTSMHPLIAWGLPDTWSDFWRQVTAQSYQGLFGASSFSNHLADALIYTANQFGIWPGILLLALAIGGLAYLWRTDRGLLAATTLAALVSFVVALNYSIREIATYYVPFYMILLLWVGLGAAQGILWLRDRLPSPMKSNAAPGLALGAILPIVALLINWGAAGHRDNYTADLFVRNAFRNYLPNAVVLTNYWDLTSLSFYYQHVLHERPDVALIDKSLMRQPFYLDYLERNYPDLISRNAGPFAKYKSLLREWISTGRTPRDLSSAYVDVLNGFIDSNLGQHPVYTAFIIPAGDPFEQQEVDALLGNRRSQLVPDGFGYHIATPGDSFVAQDPQFDLRGITGQRVPLDEIEASIVALYPGALQSIGAYMANSASQSDKDTGASLLAQAQELQPLSLFQDERPRLR